MSRRKLLAFSSVFALLMGVYVTSPATAVPQPTILHDSEFNGGQQPAPTQGADTPLTSSAMSANGERVVVASNPRGTAGCTSTSGPIWVTAGVATSTSTTWQGILPIPYSSTIDCGIVRELKISLSDDGTRGLITWIARPYDEANNISLDPEVRVATFDWDPASNSPSAINPPQTFAAGTYVQCLNQALAGDGSRAVISFLGDGGSSMYRAQYAVIDMEHPEFTRAQNLPVATYLSAPTFPVAISNDGEVVAIGTYRNTGDTGFSAFREIKIFTCQANCYANRLKLFSAMLPTNQGGQMFDLDMNDSGSRVVATWARTPVQIPGANVPARALRVLAISPLSAPKSSNVTSAVQYFNSIDFKELTFDLSPDGSRFVFASPHPSLYSFGATGASKVSAGTISSAGKLTITKVSPVSTMQADVFDARITGSPERVLVAQRSFGSEVQVLVSDSAAMTGWSLVHTVPMNQSPVSIAYSAMASRAIISSDQPDVGQFTIPRIVVTNIKSVLINTVAPTVSGVAAVGKVLTIKNGVWNATGAFTYQWLRDGIELAGEDGPTFEPEQADAGSRISVRVTHAKAGYYDRIVTSAQTAVVTGGVMSVGFLSLSDTTPQVGQTLSWTTQWAPSSGTYTYLWKVGGKVVGNGMSYTPRLADIGKTLTLTLTKTTPGFTTTTRTTDATAPIAP